MPPYLCVEILVGGQAGVVQHGGVTQPVGPLLLQALMAQTADLIVRCPRAVGGVLVQSECLLVQSGVSSLLGVSISVFRNT